MSLDGILGGLGAGTFNPTISIESDSDGTSFSISLFGKGGADGANEAEAKETEAKDGKECGCRHSDESEQFLDDVKSVKSSSSKAALIEAFVEDALKGGGAEKSGEAEASKGEAKPEKAASNGADAPSAVTSPDAPQAGDAKGPKDLAYKPLMKELGGLAEAVDTSKLPEKTQGKLLDGIADLMGKLKDAQENGGNLREVALKGVADLVRILDKAKGGEKAKGEIMDKLAETLTGIAMGKVGGDAKEAKPDAPSKPDGKPKPDAASKPDCAPKPDAECKPEEAKDSDVWTHEMKDGKAEIRLGDKYTISAEEGGAAWTVKNNETGATTRVHGDPHVDVGGDGKDDWDFKKDMTFELDDGTKITVGTVPGDNGTTWSSSLTITNGDNAIQVTGLGADKDGANNMKVVQSNAGETLDALTKDGHVVEEEGANWIGRGGAAIDQAAINAAEANA